jgi:hypothetical protein
MSEPVHISFHNGNLDPRIARHQMAVFNKFSIDLHQIETVLQHGEAIDNFLQTSPFETIYIWDIDCIPTVKALPTSHADLFGCAQQANHIDGKPMYVSPFFMRIKASEWRACGQPSFMPNEFNDVAGRVTRAFELNERPIEMLFPVNCEVPKWDLGTNSTFGLGTTYQGGIYHAFESRMNNTDMFINKCKQVLNG